MTTDAVRLMIREVLAEELAKERARVPEYQAASGKTAPVREIVNVQTDEDLQALVRHILKVSYDKSMHDRIIRGEHVFVLGGDTTHPEIPQKGPGEPATEQGQDYVVRIDDGFLSERRVETLPQGTRAVQIGPKVRFTPLARDRLRQRNIAVERIK